MATSLSALAVGSTVALNVGGTATNFLVVHQGLPSGLYDSSCEGCWLLMEELYSSRLWGTSGSEYGQAAVHTWLNGDFLALLDSDVQSLIKSVKLPCLQGGAVASGGEGVEAKVFLLSAAELGWTSSYKAGIPADGACLSYFSGLADEDLGRTASLNGSKSWYWTRSANESASGEAWTVASYNGGGFSRDVSTSYGVRPALVLPAALLVDESGALLPNSAPTLTSPSGATGTNLGLKTGPFALCYTAADPEGASLTLTELLDGETSRSFTAASGEEHTFAALADGTGFLKLTNAAHTLQVEASDGLDTAALTMTFTKAVTTAALTLTQPLTAADPITVAVLEVSGSIPTDAVFSVEATNNALDDAPVWQDVTDAVRRGVNIIFTNRTAARTPAFNFRVSAGRGSSGAGGYIDGVSGAYQ